MIGRRREGRTAPEARWFDGTAADEGIPHGCMPRTVWGEGRAGRPQRPQNEWCMNLEETIAVAIGIAVGVIFITYFLLVAAGLSLL